MMMNCEKIQDLLPDYSAGSLTTALQAAVNDHLQHCQECQMEFVVEMELKVNLGTLPPVPCPAQVTNSILEEVAEDERRQQSSGQYWLWGASTLVAAGLALILLMPSSNNDSAEGHFTPTEIRTATREASWALAKVATVINHHENQAFEQVFGQEIPGAVGESLRRLTKNLQGEV